MAFWWGPVMNIAWIIAMRVTFMIFYWELHDVISLWVQISTLDFIWIDTLLKSHNIMVLKKYHTAIFFLRHFDYRSRATAGRSRLVAAPLSFQAKNRFLCAFYVAIWRPKMQYLNCGRGLQWRGYGRPQFYLVNYRALYRCVQPKPPLTT